MLSLKDISYLSTVLHAENYAKIGDQEYQGLVTEVCPIYL